MSGRPRHEPELISAKRRDAWRRASIAFRSLGDAADQAERSLVGLGAAMMGGPQLFYRVTPCPTRKQGRKISRKAWRRMNRRRIMRPYRPIEGPIVIGIDWGREE